jgi:uncharacterized tellurite resistance protein B-like protein
MGNRTFILDLAKLLVAAAWADGDLKAEEINSLKDLLFSLPEVDAEDWQALEMYMDSPVSEEESEMLLGRVLEGISQEADKNLVLTTLENLFVSDGEITPDEKAFLDDIRESVALVKTGFIARLSKALRFTMNRRSEAAGREAQMDDYLHNTIYYVLESEMKKSGACFDAPEEKVRKLCLTAGLMARVTTVDGEVSSEELLAMATVIGKDFQLSEDEAGLILATSCNRIVQGLDQFRLCRGYFDATTLEERREFLHTLFRLAAACSGRSYDETEEIRVIAASLILSHDDFIRAKVSVMA